MGSFKEPGQYSSPVSSRMMLDGDRVSQNLGWWCSVENVRLELFDRWLPVLIDFVDVAEALHVLLESIPAVVFLGVGYHAVRHFGLDSKGSLCRVWIGIVGGACCFISD
jgi:hypothetical protein